MEGKKNNRSIAIVSLALVAVMAILVIVFLLRPADGQEGIVLPTAQQDTSQEQLPQTDNDSGFLELEIDNVVTALRSLNQPRYYRQSFEVGLFSGIYSTSKNVEVWFNGGLVHAEVRSGSQVKSVFTDGITAWIWYDTDLQPVRVDLDSSVTLEDLLGLPAFDYLDTLDGTFIADVSYELLDDDNRKCVYVCTQDGSRADRYWIDLASGLLYQADVLEDSRQVYTVLQTGFDRLAPGDQAFSGRFCLPDGTEPFIVEREMLQP